jgi:hypothetical protein
MVVCGDDGMPDMAPVERAPNVGDAWNHPNAGEGIPVQTEDPDPKSGSTIVKFSLLSGDGPQRPPLF